MRYRTARDYADEQAERYRNGENVDTYRGITGAAWVAEAYDIAAQEATSLMKIESALWLPVVAQCMRLAQEFREEASHQI